MESILYFKGKYDDAVRLFLEAIKIGETTLGKEHPDVATRYNNLALVYDAQVRFSVNFRSITAPRYGGFFRFSGQVR